MSVNDCAFFVDPRYIRWKDRGRERAREAAAAAAARIDSLPSALVEEWARWVRQRARCVGLAFHGRMDVCMDGGRTDVKLMLLINWIRGRFRRFLPRPTRKKSDMDERADGRGRDLPRPVGQTDLTSSSIWVGQLGTYISPLDMGITYYIRTVIPTGLGPLMTLLLL